VSAAEALVHRQVPVTAVVIDAADTEEQSAELTSLIESLATARVTLAVFQRDQAIPI
jgi:hypothetical protein